MSNSRLPMLLLLATSVVAIWLVSGPSSRGIDGPMVEPGILRLPVNAAKRVPADPLTPKIDLAGPAMDGTAWRVWVIAGDDREASTRTLMLGLAERLTERGCIAILAPKPKPDEASREALPLGADVRVSIASTTATSAVQGQPFAIAWRLTVSPFHLAPSHPAARLLPDDANGPAPSAWTLGFSCPGPGPSWPTWWAAVGRTGADTILARLGRTTAIEDTTAHIRRQAWLPPVTATGPGAPPVEPEHGRIPAPPQSDIAEGLMAFQTPLVRGWTGHLSPVPVTSMERGTKTAREELDRRLTKDHLWTKQEADGRILYAKDGPLPQFLTVDAAGEIVSWQERPSPASLMKAWRESPDPLAKENLARHRKTPGIPADLRGP